MSVRSGWYVVPHEDPPHLLVVVHDAVGLPRPALHFRNAERAVAFAESVNAKLELEQRFGPGAAA